jgi:hypothetical protein
MRRALTAALAVALLASLFAGATEAKKRKRGPKVASDVTVVNRMSGFYEGKVRSSVDACESRRVVVVYHDENDNGLDQGDFRIGEGTTTKSGSYVVRGNQAPRGDTVIVLLISRKLPSGTRCKGAEDDTAALSV